MLETPGDPEPAGTGLAGDLQLSAGVSLANSTQGFLQRMEIIGDGAEEADLAFGVRFGHRAGDGVLVDIQTDIEFYSLDDGVVVSSYSHDESEHVSRHERAVLAALPTRATRDYNEWQPHRPFQPRNGWRPEMGVVPSAIRPRLS